MVESMASLTYGDEEGLAEFPLRRGAARGRIALYRANAARPVARWTAGAKGAQARLPEQQLLFAYGRYRRVFDPDREQRGRRQSPSRLLETLVSQVSRRRTITLRRPDHGLLDDLSQYLVALCSVRKSDSRVDEALNRFDDSLRHLERGLSGVSLIDTEFGAIAQITRAGVGMTLSELSDGYQSVLVIILDLLLRYLYLYTELDDPMLGDATVIIDEIDLHLHPRWQRNIVAQLTSLFPRTQFVLSTHSPAVVQGAIDLGHSVVTLAERRGRVKVRLLGATLTRKLRGAGVNSLLLDSRLFGVSSRYSEKFEALEQRINSLRQKHQKGRITAVEEQELFTALEVLHEIALKDDRRREQDSYMTHVTALSRALLKDLAEANAKNSNAGNDK